MPKRFDRAIRIGALFSFIATFTVYLLTVDPSASYWDCPEYIVCGAKLEPGHPPGNPTWMLMARAATLFVSEPSDVAFAINLTSGLFTSLAAMLLYLSTVIVMRTLVDFRRRGAPLVIISSGLTAAFTFAWCDTVWFSAVEAEIYAMSIFFTALMVWVMLRWSRMPYGISADKYLVFLAYLMGLSLGVHQLNLLVLPACFLIFAFHRRTRYMPPWRVAAVVGISFIAIACLLFGMMPGMTEMGKMAELVAVNAWGFHPSTGLVAYLFLFLAVTVTALFCLARYGMARLPGKLFFSLSVFLAGLFSFGGKIWLGAILCVVMFAALMVLKVTRRKLETAAWCVLMVVLGFATFGVTMIRGYANPPVNTGWAADIFSFESYIGRDQYGDGAPLLRGRTPYSNRLIREDLTRDSLGNVTPEYTYYWREPYKLKYRPSVDGKTYVLLDTIYRYRTAPELDMWFPRIHSGDPSHIEQYGEWIGMTLETMTPVLASETVDSSGNAVGRLVDAKEGIRKKKSSQRPTYLQDLGFFAGYQTGYMYFRYFLWNYSGRQNDVNAQGQADAGNFITGIPWIDDLMLGPQGKLPSDIGHDNPGHNVFFMIPLIVGIIGAVWMARRGRRGRRDFYVVLMLFLMTGLAIVVYLNQTPGEPRERDYAFMGSLWAFSIWIGAAVGGIYSRLTVFREERAVPVAWCVSLGGMCLSLWMLAVNFNDHDRSHRTMTTDFAANILLSAEKDAIIFVDGDNYTFPIWYVQEVEGIRPDILPVNLAYSTTPWYIHQLLIPGPGRKPLPLTGEASDFMHGRIRRVSFTPSDGGYMDAVEALKEMYAGFRKTGETVLPSSRLLIAPRHPGGDSLRVDLGKVMGKRYLTQAELVILDMVATNASQGWERPIYWHRGVKGKYAFNFGPYRRRTGPLYMLTTDSRASRHPDLQEEARLILDVYRYGGLSHSGIYADNIVRLMVAPERRQMLVVAKELLESGDTATAYLVARKIHEEMPTEAVPYRTRGMPYEFINEGVVTGEIYCAAAEMNGGDEVLRQEGLGLMLREIERSAEYAEYYLSLSPRLRATLTNETMLAYQGRYVALLAYIEAGGNPDAPEVRRLIGNKDIGEVLDMARKSHALRRMLSNARQVASGEASDSVVALFYADMELYFALGGTREELEKYKEFNGIEITAGL